MKTNIDEITAISSDTMDIILLIVFGHNHVRWPNNEAVGVMD